MESNYSALLRLTQNVVDLRAWGTAQSHCILGLIYHTSDVAAELFAPPTDNCCEQPVGTWEFMSNLYCTASGMASKVTMLGKLEAGFLLSCP